MALRKRSPRLFAAAIDMFEQADRLHRQFFTLALGRSGPCWEPPVDIIEGDEELAIRVALPGVPANAVQVRTEGSHLHVVGVRPLNAGPRDTIHRLEIPYGHFERRIDLPPGRYEIVKSELSDGCLVIALRRIP